MDINVEDSQNNSCSLYTEFPENCGLFDDDDFDANRMCCGCGGGLKQPYY